MTTPERLDALLRMFNEMGPIARTLGMTLSFTDDRRAVVDLPYNPGLDHAQGGVHGGIYATLLDTAGWFTAAAAHDADSWIATSEMSLHFLLPVRALALRAVGRLLKTGRRQDIAEMHLYDGEGRLVGHAAGTFIILPGIPAERTDNDTQG